MVFSKRPGVDGQPHPDNFRYESLPYPDEPVDGELLVQNLYLSVDPAQRCQMNESTGADYLSAWQLDEPIPGLGGVGVVLNSNHSDFSEGDIITSGMFQWPWKLFFNIDARKVTKVDRKIVGERLSLPLSCLGLVGLTALFGITERSKLRQLPSDGSVRRTLVISGAAGACGHLAGQIARLEGADYVVGICGTNDKCHFLTNRVGFDAAINYKLEDVEDRLRQLCPDGVNCYFDNTGGPISDAVLPQMCKDSTVVLCGQISVYNTSVPYPPPLSDHLQHYIDTNGIERNRFLVLHYEEMFDAGLAKLARWLHSGAIKVFETIEDGLDHAGNAFCSMMSGGNIGKQLVQVSQLPTCYQISTA